MARLLSVALLLGAFGGTSFAVSTTVDSPPLGSFPITIAAGNGTSRTISFISFPLQGTASITGLPSGIISGTTSNTLTCSTAGWTAAALSAATTPYCIQITSGSAAGRTFLISTSTPNTSTTVTLDATDASTVDLATLGIAPGTDSFQIIPADTISSVFGTPGTTGVLGGTSATVADQVQVFSFSTGWSTYYYNASNGWVRANTTFSAANVVIRPDTGVIYSRLGSSAITLQLMGQAPTIQRVAAVSNSVVTVLSSNWPVDMTLATSGISNTTGWVGGASSTSDEVQVYSSATGWISYYYNGAHWSRVNTTFNNNSVAIPAGTAVIIQKKTAGTGYSVLTQPLPYTL